MHTSPPHSWLSQRPPSPLQTANTTSFLLHLVASNPQVQDAVHLEVVKAAGRDGPITAEVLSKLPLVKGCVKEALR